MDGMAAQGKLAELRDIKEMSVEVDKAQLAVALRKVFTSQGGFPDYVITKMAATHAARVAALTGPGALEAKVTLRSNLVEGAFDVPEATLDVLMAFMLCYRPRRRALEGNEGPTGHEGAKGYTDANGDDQEGRPSRGDRPTGRVPRTSSAYKKRNPLPFKKFNVMLNHMWQEGAVEWSPTEVQTFHTYANKK